MHFSIRRKLEIGKNTHYSLNLRRCETGDSIGLFAWDFAVVIQKKSPNALKENLEDRLTHSS